MRRKLDSAEFTEEITLQTRTEDDLNECGEELEGGTWEDSEITRWGAVTQPSGNVEWVSGQELVDATHIVEIWYDPEAAAISPQLNRLLWGDRVLRILRIDDIGNRHHRLAFICTERTGAV